MKNFETPYFYMMKSLVNFLDEENGAAGYENSRKYLPNYMRRILETFINFKFCIFNSKNNKDKSMGLKEFTDKEIPHISLPDVTVGEITKENLFEKISEINRICDTYSHGNSHNTHENHYISETELKRIARNTLDIITFFDSNHTFLKNSKPVPKEISTLEKS
jgi:hypothetical protein